LIEVLVLLKQNVLGLEVSTYLFGLIKYCGAAALGEPKETPQF
jgi:hypothetical protein